LNAWGRLWILDPLGEATTEELEEGADLVVVEQATQLRACKRLLELVEQALRYDELELPLKPLAEQARWRSCTRE